MNGGHGTMAPSYALANYLNKIGCKTCVIDIMAEANPIGMILANFYNFLLRHSIFSAAMYMEFAHAFPIDRFRPYNAIGRHRTLKTITRERPDAIVMICPWISRMIVSAVNSYHRKEKYRPLLLVDIVDLGADMTTSWVNNDVDFTFIPTENARKYLSGRGLDMTKAEVFGVPLYEDFSPGPISSDERTSSRAKYDIKDDSIVVTILGGREGVKNTERILQELLKELTNVEFMVQCGLNRKLYIKIRKFASKRKNVHPLGFVDSIRELYALSDVAISKPGALTVSELVVSQVPFIIDAWPVVMPQERGNVGFVTENKLGFVAVNIKDIPPLVNKILSENAKGRAENLKNETLRSSLYGTNKIGDWIIAALNGQKGDK